MQTSNPQPFKVTPVFEWNYNSKKPIVINQGGTSSGKTYGILTALLCKCITEARVVATVVGQDIPNLKVGCIRDTQEIIADSKFFQFFVSGYNSQDKCFNLKNGSILEFKSYDDWQDAKSGRRDYLFINEANGVPFEIVKELRQRTKKRVFIDYNPNAEFWAHEMIREMQSGQRTDIDFFISNFSHNPYCPPLSKQIILDYKRLGDDNNWRVYGLGLTGQVQGLVFPNCKSIDKFPDAETVYYGLDFGFSNDPTVLSRGTLRDGDLILDQMIYETGMTNEDIDARFKEIGITPGMTIYADSADPKSIEELRRKGWDIREAIKGKDSINFGITHIKGYKNVYITAHSGQAWKEQRSYSWDKRAKDANKPIDKFNHFWDSVRYMLSPLSMYQHDMLIGTAK